MIRHHQSVPGPQQGTALRYLLGYLLSNSVRAQVKLCSLMVQQSLLGCSSLEEVIAFFVWRASRLDPVG